MGNYSKKIQKISNAPWRLKLQNVSVAYNAYTVLKDISFTIDSGDYLYIVGPNGSGKTTLIKLLTGLISPSSGTCHIGDVTYGYLPQKLNVKRWFPITVEDVIYSGLKKQHFIIPQGEKATIKKWLDIMEIPEVLKKPMGILSGGQQQRIFLIRALISNPDVLILDEPTSALDPHFRSTFNTLIDELHHKGTTILYVTHDLHDVSHTNKKVMHLDQTLKYFGDIKGYYHILKGENGHVRSI